MRDFLRRFIFYGLCIFVSVYRIYSQVQYYFCGTNIHSDLIKMVFVDLVCVYAVRASFAPSSVVLWLLLNLSHAGRQRIKSTDRTQMCHILFLVLSGLFMRKHKTFNGPHEDASSRPLVPFTMSLCFYVCLCAWTTKQTIDNTDEIKTYAFIKDNLLIARS